MTLNRNARRRAINTDSNATQIDVILDRMGADDLEYTGSGMQSSRTAITRDWVLWDYTSVDGERSVRITPRARWDSAYRQSVAQGGGVLYLHRAIPAEEWIAVQRTPKTYRALKQLAWTWLRDGCLPYRAVTLPSSAEHRYGLTEYKASQI